MTTLKVICEALHGNEDAVESWLRRKILKTRFAPGTPGRARQLSRANAMELGLMFALTDVGFDASEASYFARDLMKAERDRSLGEFFAFDPVSGNTISVASDQRLRTMFGIPTFGMAEGYRVGSAAQGYDRPTNRLRVIWVGAIIRVVDELFSGDGT